VSLHLYRALPASTGVMPAPCLPLGGRRPHTSVSGACVGSLQTCRSSLLALL
jgi:hypothetical protein